MATIIPAEGSPATRPRLGPRRSRVPSRRADGADSRPDRGNPSRKASQGPGGGARPPATSQNTGGTGAWEGNRHFLDAGTFEQSFVRRLRPHADRLGPLIFEFGTFNKSTFPTPGDILARLDPFLAALPDGFRYAVEIRNPEYLIPDYLELLKACGVAHVFNVWTRMPGLEDQVQLPDAFTADFTVVRALLKKGRAYEQAVRSFEPYWQVKELNEDARGGFGRIAESARARRVPAFLFVNNRLEGHAPSTIKAVVDSLSP